MSPNKERIERLFVVIYFARVESKSMPAKKKLSQRKVFLKIDFFLNGYSSFPALNKKSFSAFERLSYPDLLILSKIVSIFR